MNDLSFIDFLAQSYNSSPDAIKFAWIFGFSTIILALIICATWFAIRWRELTNERTTIEINRQLARNAREEFQKIATLFEENRSEVPSHITRQENYLPEYDKENLDAWLIDNKQAIEELRQKAKADNNDHECSENAIKPLILAPEASATETEPTPNAPELVTPAPPPPFPYKDDGGNGDGSSGDDKKDRDQRNNACHELPDAAWLKPIAGEDENSDQNTKDEMVHKG